MKRSKISQELKGFVFLGDNRGQEGDKALSTFRFSTDILASFAKKELKIDDFHCTPKTIRRFYASLGGSHVSF